MAQVPTIKPHLRWRWGQQYSLYHAAVMKWLQVWVGYKGRLLVYVSSMYFDESRVPAQAVVDKELAYAMRRAINPILKSIARHERKLLNVKLPRGVRPGLHSLADHG